MDNCNIHNNIENKITSLWKLEKFPGSAIEILYNWKLFTGVYRVDFSFFFPCHVIGENIWTLLIKGQERTSDFVRIPIILNGEEYLNMLEILKFLIAFYL